MYFLTFETANCTGALVNVNLVRTVNLCARKIDSRQNYCHELMER